MFKWHVVDTVTGEILFESPDQDLCIEVAAIIKRASETFRSLWVL